ncbi:MAG: DUF4834 family protein [Bacteroidota bacterium]|nr:DUF4834 family protein [Bacteroidota bacterium]
MGFLKTILIIMLIYYGIKFLGRLLAPVLLKRFAKKMQDRFQQQYRDPQNQPQEEGKVTLEKTNTSPKTKSDDVGDYVDFEEVEE